MSWASTGRRFAAAAGGAAVVVAGTARPAAADVPGAGIVQDLLGGAAGWAFEEIAEGIAKWVLGAVAFFVEGALRFLQTSGRPEVEADWFAGDGSPFAAVRDIAAVLLLAFAFLAILQGLLHGDIGLMVRQVAGKLPVAVAGMVLTVVVVAKLLDLTDALSAAVLSSPDDQALHFLSGFGVTVTSVSAGFAAVVLGLLAVLAALVLWVELIVRASLVYLLVAISPLGFAAMVWPSARGFLRKTVELLVAVILSKFVIAVALSVGVAALAGAGEAAAADGNSAGLGTLLVGAVLLGLAAFAPFIVLKLVPAAEAALVAQGVSRGPVRATQSGVSTYSSVSRLAGSRSRAGAPPGSGAPPAAGANGTAAAGTASAGTAAAGAAAAAAGVATAAIAGASVPARRAAGAADRAGEAAPDGRRPRPGDPGRSDPGADRRSGR